MEDLDVPVKEAEENEQNFIGRLIPYVANQKFLFTLCSMFAIIESLFLPL
jgi:hypothetical protein